MNERNGVGGLIAICLTGAGFSGAVWLAAQTQLWPNASRAEQFMQAFLFAFIVFCFLSILVNIPGLVTYYLEHKSYWRKLSAVPDPKPSQASQETLQQTPQHKYGREWFAYWLAALAYAQEVGGVSFSKTKDFFAGDWATWRECFAGPMMWADYIQAIVRRKETILADDWTIDKIRWAIEGGVSRLAPLPYPPPTPFEQYKAAQTANNSEGITTFASTTRK